MQKIINKQLRKFVEKGANLEHERWAGWQAYLFSKSEWTKNGYLIPKELCKRWQRQIDTPYSKLSEEEKESDRKEVRKYLPLLSTAIKEAVSEVLAKMKILAKEEKVTNVNCAYCMDAQEHGLKGEINRIIAKLEGELK